MTSDDKANSGARGFRSDEIRNKDFRDDDLRARFVELRRDEEAQAPGFAFPPPQWIGQSRRWSARRLIAGAVCAITLVAAVLWLRFVPSQRARTGQPVASLTEWRSPTDFLLETPGRELLRSVPSIGVWSDRTPASKRRPNHPPVKKQVLP